MSGDYQLTGKIVSPVKCNEKPWDLWVSEIGHSSPRVDEPARAEPESKGAARRPEPYKAARRARYRRTGLHRLRNESMSLHGLFPQVDPLDAAVCHMCGMTVKCSAVYKHLQDTHSGSEPLLPPPPPAPTVKLKSSHSRSRHKKEILPPPPPLDPPPVKIETSPIHTATAPLSRIVVPQPDLQYLEEPSTSAGVTGEVQVCVESGELPVVSIQDTDDLHLGEHLTDDIFAIMNSEGIQSADDIANSADWKNIIRDIGNMQDINFQPDLVQSQDVFPPVDAALSAFTLTEADLTSLQLAAAAAAPPAPLAPLPAPALPLLPVLEPAPAPAPVLPPLPPPVLKSTPATPSKSQSRSKTSKTKFNLREYDPNKHCGVVTADNPKPCTRSLTCKAHALSLRRTVEGRAKPFDTLLAEHRASRDAAAAPAAPLAAPPALPALDLPYNGLVPDAHPHAHVEDVYASLLSVEAALPDTGGLSALLGHAAVAAADERVSSPAVGAAAVVAREEPSAVPDVCWYAASPRPLALCSFNAAHAGGAVTLGKRFATVRSNIKSSLSRSACKAGGAGAGASGGAGAAAGFYFGQSALSLSKTVHMNSAHKAAKPEVRKVVVTCGATAGGGGRLGELLAGEARLAVNGHSGRALGKGAHQAHGGHGKRSSAVLDLGFVLDPLLDEKC